MQPKTWILCYYLVINVFQIQNSRTSVIFNWQVNVKKRTRWMDDFLYIFIYGRKIINKCLRGKEKISQTDCWKLPGNGTYCALLCTKCLDQSDPTLCSCQTKWLNAISTHSTYAYSTYAISICCRFSLLRENFALKDLIDKLDNLVKWIKIKTNSLVSYCLISIANHKKLPQ